MNNKSYYWFDFETFGTNPAIHWPAQFAGIRTDLDFNEIEQPLELFCKLPQDQIPEIEACLITGLTPQYVNTHGLLEPDFMRTIDKKLRVSGTCALGYNTLRFDDEVIRHSLYRNFFDPYYREWANGNTRWDLIDVVRVFAALKPESIAWPVDEDNNISCKLELLTVANGIDHSAAHDAVSDVRATISLAKLLRKKELKLFEFVRQYSTKSNVIKMLDLFHKRPVLHISGMYSNKRKFAAPVVPLLQHPLNKNGIIVYDLMVDPTPMLDLNVNEIHERIFSNSTDLELINASRIPLKTVHTNRCPVLIPWKYLRHGDFNRLNIDIRSCKKNYGIISENITLQQKLEEVFLIPFKHGSDNDPELMLYSGGFFSDNDKRKMAKITACTPEELAKLVLDFEDHRLKTLLFRYKARNWPEILNQEEIVQWFIFCREKLLKIDEKTKFSLIDYTLEEINKKCLNESKSKTKILKELSAYLKQLKINLNNMYNTVPI